LIRDGEDEDEAPPQQDDEDMMQQERQQEYVDDGKSKLVQEAKAMMGQAVDDDEAKPPADENAGPKIKMGRIGKKKRTNEAKGKEGGVSTVGASKERSQAPDEMDNRGGEGFTE